MRIGAGKKNSRFSPEITSVFFRIRQKDGPVKKRVKCFTPTQGLLKNPFMG